MMTSANSDKDKATLCLLEEYRNGDEEAFNALYRLYSGPMLRYGLSLTSDEEMVKDCMQDVFLQLVVRCRKQVISKVGSYLFASLRNRIRDEFRKEASHSALSADLILSMEHAESSEAQLIRREADSRIHKNVISLFSELTPRQQEAFRLYFIEQRKYNDICKTLKMSNPSVRNLVCRGMARIHASSTYQRILAGL